MMTRYRREVWNSLGQNRDRQIIIPETDEPFLTESDYYERAYLHEINQYCQWHGTFTRKRGSIRNDENKNREREK